MTDGESTQQAHVPGNGRVDPEPRHGGGLGLGDEVLLLILTRVREGRIWRYYPGYLDDGRRVWVPVARALDGCWSASTCGLARWVRAGSSEWVSLSGGGPTTPSWVGWCPGRKTAMAESQERRVCG